MGRPKILILCEEFGGGEKSLLGTALLDAATRKQIPEDMLKSALRDHVIIMEELKGKAWSELLTTDKEIGFVLIVGTVAYGKVEIQNLKDFRYAVIPQPRVWDEASNRTISGKLELFLEAWYGTSVVPLVPVIKQPIPMMTETAIDQATEVDLEAIEAFLQIEISNSRMQACVFHWNQDGGEILLTSTSQKLHVAIENLVPVLVADEILKDEEKIKTIRDSLAASGYKNPYLMPIREFTMLIRMYQILAKERKVILQLVA